MKRLTVAATLLIVALLGVQALGAIPPGYRFTDDSVPGERSVFYVLFDRPVGDTDLMMAAVLVREKARAEVSMYGIFANVDEWTQINKLGFTSDTHEWSVVRAPKDRRDGMFLAFRSNADLLQMANSTYLDLEVRIEDQPYYYRLPAASLAALRAFAAELVGERVGGL
jgi:hypothetical protein